MIDLSTLLPPITVTAESEIGRLLTSRGLPLTSERHRVMGTRSMAHEILGQLPPEPVVLDCSSIDVMSPPFIHELRLAREDLTFANMNEDVQLSWQLVDERMKKA